WAHHRRPPHRSAHARGAGVRCHAAERTLSDAAAVVRLLQSHSAGRQRRISRPVPRLHYAAVEHGKAADERPAGFVRHLLDHTAERHARRKKRWPRDQRKGHLVSMSLVRELEVARRLALEAGDVTLRYHGTELKVERKDEGEPVTRADKEANA